MLAHLGHPWRADTIAVVRKHTNVFADVSAQFYRPFSMWQGLYLFYEWGVISKILPASDWPVTKPQETIDSLRALPKWTRDHSKPSVPERELEGIINRDSVDLLGLG